ncbi:MAG TPA: hypothetical protein VGC76_13615 [Pyrinomonadaceae bacterium]|jgi:hypothetical protein
MIQQIEYLNFPNCLEISNGAARLVISTDFGPRVLFYGLTGGENILGFQPDAKVETRLGEWRAYGGHRLWAAPENMPLSYAPDNEPVEYFIENDFSVRLFQPLETATGTQKEIIVSLNENGSGATVEHRITNYGKKRIELAAWALTIMREGGVCIIPNEDFKPYGTETLLPVRNLTLWSYTNLTDSRWRFETDSIRLRVDENRQTPQKIGVLNRKGWAAYARENLLFVKRFDFVENASYPDMNSNTEIYTSGGFVELESLSPLQKLGASESIIYTERWQLLENVGVEELIKND